MKIKFALCALAAIALAACGEKASEAPPPSDTPAVTDADGAAAPDAAGDTADTAEDLCHAADYQSLVGQNIAAVTLPADLNHRVIKPGDVVTEEFNAERLNIHTDETGVITEVKCG
jgi:hypothetical protein